MELAKLAQLNRTFVLSHAAPQGNIMINSGLQCMGERISGLSVSYLLARQFQTFAI